MRPKNKDRVFIFGSGYSLNEISPEGWDKIRSQGDTMSFNKFFYSTFIDLDYYIFREVEAKSFEFLPARIQKRLISILPRNSLFISK